MQLDMLVMPNIAKMEFSMDPNYWEEEMLRIKSFFVSKDIYTTGPIIFTKEIIGLDEASFTTYIALNDEIEDIPELNIEFLSSLEVLPTISHKCFDDDDFEQVYLEIQRYAQENNVVLMDKPYYHVVVDYFDGQIYEIHAEVDVDGVDIDE
ncbi:DUF5085 family protein [Staphylococcus caprae]|uniref:DUF5085 family protein n=1 Tax=Staphylococcus TaxID=1279 RepID=UPI0008A86BA9|nr:DUF5085 family protein [Staphylococcus sp. HMSC036D05]OHO71467.1 hypothetical protein HMPREF2580_09115 [Staphylococcus sp. HMSC036D05]